MSCLCVNGLDLTPIALGSADVDEGPVEGTHAVGVQGREVAAGQRKGQPERRLRLRGLQQVPGSHPGSEAAIQHADVESGPTQHPPGASGGEGAGVVVDHDRQCRIDAECTQAGAELVDIGEGVPAQHRVDGRSGQHRFQVEEARFGQVALQVAVEAAAGTLAQPPADIEQLRAGCQLGGQVIDSDQDVSASGHS